MCSIRIDVKLLLILLITLSFSSLVDSLSSAWRNPTIKRTTPSMKDIVTFTLSSSSDNEDNEKKIRSNVLDEGNAMGSSRNSKGLLIGFLASTFACIISIAKLNLIGNYTDENLCRDIGMALLSTILGTGFVKIITKCAMNGVIPTRDSRKIIHSFSAPLFMLLWPFFSNAWGARFFAATIPLLQAVRLLMAALEQGGEDGIELIHAISRSGDTKEALKGPFVYTVVLFMTIICCFRDSFAGMMSLSAMAAGDGFADLVGRRMGKKNKWFFHKDKSVAGTFAFIVASSLCAIGIGCYFQRTGAIPIRMAYEQMVTKFVIISIFSAFIELMPIGDDNWSVPIAAAVMSCMLLP